jgi:hypothetical protein
MRRLKRVAGFLMLGERESIADAKTLPKSYRDTMRSFGAGSFCEERWLLEPDATQPYGSLFGPRDDGKPMIKDKGLASMTIFAASDNGDYWAWSSERTETTSAEPSVVRIPCGCFDLDDPFTRPRVVAKDVRDLVDGWRSELAKRGVEEPYFVPKRPLILVSDIALSAPKGAAKTTHGALARALVAIGATRLVHASYETTTVSRFFLHDARALFALQTHARKVLHKDAKTDSTLRLQWLDEDFIDATKPALDVVETLGWSFAKQKKAGTVVLPPKHSKLETLPRLFAAYDVKLR